MSDKKEQIRLFEDDEDWKKEWKDMPEYVQKDLMPIKTIRVHFEKQEDVKKFAELVGQKIGMKTPSIWFPAPDIFKPGAFRYVDVDDDEKEKT